ncbi:MAG: pantoate--beta-alanine ligase [Gammaproteobacteria bacterium]|nr:pantoate--beta-alanine ligase [Gammaproteobacteria bacterium]
MKISNTIESLRTVIKQWHQDGLQVGFVPTMGHLHAGHMELVNQAKLSCDKVVVSIFVNPLQFNEISDYESYPQSLAEDQKQLINVKTDLLFLPDNEMMYAANQQLTTKVCVPGISQVLEGECRPGHFDGVSTIVNKLLNLVQPQQAFFGEKDYQQLLLIRKMVNDLNIPVDIKSVTTHREVDGLAMSSRNSRLSKLQRGIAPQLYGVLKKLAERISNNELSIVKAEAEAVSDLKRAGFVPEYVSVRNGSTLHTADEKSANRRVLAAVRLGEVRLIDNISID